MKLCITASLLNPHLILHDPIHQRINPSTQNCFRFSQVVIMSQELYTSMSEEMIPVNFTPLEICDIPFKEDEDVYRRRIENIVDLRKSRVFDVENVVFRIQQELFDPVLFQGLLLGEQEQRYGM